MKKILSFAFLFLLISGFSFVFAQSPQEEISADISIIGVNLPSSTYKAGDSVTGSFDLKNNSDFPSQKLGYVLVLAGDFGKNTLAKNFYGGTDVIELGALKPNEAKRVDFNYNLPKGIGGNNMAVQVQLYAVSGDPLGWKDSKMLGISGGIAQLSIEGTGIIINRNNESIVVPPTTGPVIYKDQEPKNAELSFILKNSNTQDISVTPEITVYDTLKDDAVVYNSKLKNFTVLKNASSTQTYSLPTIEYKPSVYLAKVELKDANGDSRASEFFYRYIVSGNVVDILDVASDKISVSKKESFNLNIKYTDAPFDFLAGDEAGEKGEELKVPNYKNKLLVTVYNEENEVVASGESEIGSLNENKEVQLALTANEDAQILKVSIEAVDAEGNSLDTFTKNLEQAGDIIVKSGISLGMYIVILLVLLAIIISLIVIDRKSTTSAQKTLIIALLVVGTVFAGLGTVKSYTVVSQTWTKYMNGCQYFSGTNTTLSEPVANKVFKPNDEFQVLGNVSFQQCKNTPANATITIKDRTTNQTNSWTSDTYASCTNAKLCFHVYTSRSEQYSVGPFRAATVDGTHILDIVSQFNNGACGRKIVATHPYVVESNALTASCTINPNPAAVGQTVTWNGNASGGSQNYTYSWSGAVSGSGQSKTSSHSSVGSYSSTLTVTDSAGRTDSDSCSAQVCNGGVCSSCPSGQKLCNGLCVLNSETCSGGNGGGNGDNGNTTGNGDLSDMQVDILTFIASPVIIAKNKPCTLEWKYDGNPTNCTLSSVNGTVPVAVSPRGEGTYQTGNLNSTTNYKFTCWNDFSSSSADAQCIVNPNLNEF